MVSDFCMTALRGIPANIELGFVAPNMVGLDKCLAITLWRMKVVVNAGERPTSEIRLVKVWNMQRKAFLQHTWKNLNTIGLLGKELDLNLKSSANNMGGLNKF